MQTKIDSCIRLSPSASKEFHRLMTKDIDVESLRRRDEFVSGIILKRDENGVLTVDCSNWDIDVDAIRQLLNEEDK